MKVMRAWRTITQRVLGLILLAGIALLLAIAPGRAIDLQTGEDIRVPRNQVIEQSLYAAGDRVRLDGTIRGSAFLAGSEVIIDGTIEDDLYVAGDQITINGTVQGDVLAIGAVLNLNGTVRGDITAAGRAIVINGAVGDDVRMAAQVMLLAVTQVQDDVVAAGFSLEQLPGSTVGGSLTFAGSQALLAGRINRNVVGPIGALEIRGQIGQSVNVWLGREKSFRPPFATAPIEIPRVSSGLTVTSTAAIAGEIAYQSTIKAAISPQAQIAGPVNATLVEPWTFTDRDAGDLLFQQLQRFLTLLLIGWLLLQFLPHWIQDLTQTVRSQPWLSLGWGALTLIAVGVLTIILLSVTLLLALVAAITLPDLAFPLLGVGAVTNLALGVSFLLFTQFVPPVVLSLLGGQWLLRRVQPRGSMGSFLPLLIGLVILMMLTAIPIVGSLLTGVIMVIGLGAFWLWGKARFYPPADEKF